MTCVVTGASSGIGAEVARALARSDVKLILSGRSEERLSAISQELGAEFISGNVADPQHSQALFARVQDSESVAAVFAAGVAKIAPTLEQSLQDWKEHIDTNLSGMYYCCRAAIECMLPRGGGKIVNVLSVASRVSFANGAAYVASKHGGLGLTRALSDEFRKSGIIFTAFMPGSVDTPLWDSMSWRPNAADMLTCADVGNAIAQIVLSTAGGVYDEVLYMPPKGFL